MRKASPSAYRLKLFFVLLSVFVASCASRPTIRSHSDPSADFSSYQTFGFASELGTDRGGYSTLITRSFRNAVQREMTARGYRYVESGPDLVANFNSNVREETDIRTTTAPSATVGVGYYGYRYGMYSAWPMYQYSPEVTTTHYQVGTANIDIVDTSRNQLVWEGIGEARLTNNDLSNMDNLISDAVAQIFAEYPVQP